METLINNGATVTGPNRNAVRHRLPDERRSVTHHFCVGGHKGYITVGLYDDGTPGELFLKISKEGSTVSGLMDSFATAVSLALQYGVPLEILCTKFSHMRFEPSGWTGNDHIGYAKSLVDYIFRWIDLRFLKGEQRVLFTEPNAVDHVSNGHSNGAGGPSYQESSDSPSCNLCGSIMTRNGSCYCCISCGQTTGCS